MDLLFLCLGLLSLILVLILRGQCTYWQNQGIPCVEKCYLLFGNMWKVITMKEAFSTLCERLYKKGSDKSMIGFYQMTTPSLLLRDPDLVKRILITNFSSFEDNQIEVDSKLDPLLFKNPFFSHKATWKENRIALTNGFSSSKLKLMFYLIREVSFKFNKYLEKKLKTENSFLEVQLKELFSMYTGEIVSVVGLGVEGNCFDENSKTFGKMISSVFDNPAVLGGFAQVCIFFLPRLAKFLKLGIVSKQMDSFFRESVTTIVETTKNDKTTRNDFLHIILENEKDGIIKDDDLASYMLSFILDAHETTATTLSFLAIQLAKHPEVQEKVRQEINSVHVKYNNIWEYEALKDLVYLEQTIHESMRLNSALGTLIKVCTSKIQLEGFDGLSCKLEPGNIIALSIHGLHKDKNYWPDPENFDPDRFSEENKKDRHKFVFLPFGEGPRMCLGRRFAMMSIKMSIIAILSNFSLELSSKTDFPLKQDPTSFFTSVEGGLWVVIKPLNKL